MPRQNPTDREQDILEQAEFDGGIPVHTGDGVTRVRVKARGAVERNIAGVVTESSDPVGSFPSDTIGRV